jgi:hypothetical protein
MWELISGAYFYGINKKNTEKKFQFGDYVLWFPKGEKTYLGKFKKRSFGPFRVEYCLPNNIVFLFLLTILKQTQYWSMLIS